MQHTIVLIILFTFFHANKLWSQNDKHLPQTFTLTNHGKDFPNSNSYFFGVPQNANEKKGIAINNEAVASRPTHNGLMIYAISKDSLAKGSFHPYLRDNNVQNQNGMYYFDYMLTETAVNQEIVDSLAAYLKGIPNNYLLFVISGYYHQTPMLGESVFQQFEKFGSKRIRIIKENEVWIFYGTNCKNDEAIEQSTTNQNEVLKSNVQVTTTCLNTSVSSPKSKNWQLFPNPSSGTTYINSSNILKVNIFDLQGKLVHEPLIGNEISFYLKPGLYVLKIWDGQKPTYQQLVVR